MIPLEIRPPGPDELPSVYNLIKAAFAADPFSDHKEQELVRRLLDSPAFIPGLSLCAINDSKLCGYVLVTRVHIARGAERFPCLSLAPVCVLPEYQGRGVGHALIQSAHSAADSLDESGIVLVGHDTYYPRFGYQQASGLGVVFPFDIPEKYCMVKVFEGKTVPAGQVEYPPEFYR